MELSKTTLNMAARLGTELCTSAFINELHIILDADSNDCACVSYVLVDGVYTVQYIWDGRFRYPNVLKDDLEVRKLLKYLNNIK